MKLAAIAVAVSGFVLGAGPLDPPTGPVVPTFKTLGQVEPRTAISASTTPGDEDSMFRITQAGSYYLTGDIFGTSGKRGIEIASDNVSIDLNGFMVRGTTGTREGIRAMGASYNVCISGGSIRGWGGDGLELGQVRGARVTDVRAVNGLGGGIVVGEEAVVLNCQARTNQGFGIVMGQYGRIVDSIADDNFLEGLYIGAYSNVTGCVATRNGEAGIRWSGKGVMENCTAGRNAGTGLLISGRGLVRGCSANENGENGISLVNEVVLTDCHASSNTGAGIHVSGGSCRVQHNHVTNNGVGVRVVSTDNFIAANTATNNTAAYQIPPGNLVGTILAGNAEITAHNSWVNFSQ